MIRTKLVHFPVVIGGAYLGGLALLGSASSQDFPIGVTVDKPSITDGWQICNNSSNDSVWIAYSHYEQAEGWITEGWYTIALGECTRLLSALKSRYIYYYAEGSDGSRWPGEDSLCADPSDAFTHRGEGCSGNKKWFSAVKVDTGDNSGFTTILID